jgi:hypothetical protein
MTKDIYKNRNLYYILVPVLVALWPLLVWAVYLPNTERNKNSDIAQYEKAQERMTEILTLDSDRLKLADAKTGAAEFDYVKEVYRIAALSGIPQANCSINSGIIMTSGEQKSQSAKVILKEVDVLRFAKFLSAIQVRWADLQCTMIRMTKKKGLPDTWDVDMDFKYYY